jgi:mono/diheme cytochrome c family protein
MIWGIVVLTLLLVLALAYTLQPLRRPGQPFPHNPRPEELLAEIELLKAQAREAEGVERKRLLAQIVLLERELGAQPEAGGVPRRKLAAWIPLTVVGLMAVTGLGLYAYTLPRLPGETTVTARKEAEELRQLERRAQQSGLEADYLALGNRAYQLGDIQRAADAYLAVVGRNPQQPEAIRRLGIFLFMSGSLDEAIQLLQLATAAQPDEPEGWLFLGNAYFSQQKPSEAIVAWEGYLAAGGEAQERVKGLIETARAQAVQPVTPDQPISGQQAYLARCASCHGAQAQGGVGPRLAGNPVVKVRSAVAEIILKGRGTMAALDIPIAETNAILDYLEALP